MQPSDPATILPLPSYNSADKPQGATFAPLAPRQRGRAAPAPAGGQAAGTAALGNDTRNVSARPAPDAQRRGRRIVRRYKLLDTAAQLLPGHRVAWCGRLVLGESVTVLYHAEHASASYGGVAACGSVWLCPVCATRIAIARADELARGAASWGQRGGQLLMLTLTLRHQRGQRLAALLAAINGAYRELRQGRAFQHFKKRFGMVGTVTAREITHGINGWHPHLHAVIFLSKYAIPSEQIEMRKWLYERWKKALAKYGLNATYEHGISLQDVAPENIPYLSKQAEAWAAANETTGGAAKSARPGHHTPPQLLALAAAGDKRAARLYVEYAAATKGLKMIVWSKGLRKLLLNDENEKSDQEIAEEKQADAIILFELTLSQWGRILKYSLRGELLAECCTGDIDAPVQFLAGWGVVLCSSQMRYTVRDKTTV